MINETIRENLRNPWIKKILWQVTMRSTLYAFAI